VYAHREPGHRGIPTTHTSPTKHHEERAVASTDATDTERSTANESYTDRPLTLEASGLKRFVPVQAPYRMHLRNLKLGRVIDIGCGIGRNLLHLGGNGVGIDHNPHSVAAARSRGLAAYVPEDFFATDKDARSGSFDSMLVAHVLEHIDADDTADLFRQYLPYVRPNGRIVLITPQEAGFASDATHICWVDFDVLRETATEAGITTRRTYSFPFPRSMGKAFRYNEFVFIGSTR
jgi:2-polyprenyl-3-methyl-5-hydroxy-6-metoxy-1,4-benzoquinol methylase